MLWRDNSFQSRLEPDDYRGEAAGAAYIRHGFHVATEIERIIPYAQQKVATQNFNEDYPVLVELDLAGLEYEADIDDLRALYGAFAIVRDMLTQATDEWTMEMFPGIGDFPAARGPDSEDLYIQYTQVEGLLSALTDEGGWRSEGWDHLSPPRPGNSVIEYLFSFSGYPEARPLLPLVAYLEDKDDEEVADIVNVVLGYFVTNGFFGYTPGWTPYRLQNVSPDIDRLAADIFGQRRYSSDVPSDRIVAVTYMKPYWPSFVAGDEYNENFNQSLEEAGFQLFDAYDYDFSLDVDSSAEIDISPRRYGAIRLFHGTTYHNLLSAAPELEHLLPEPPKPYGLPGSVLESLEEWEQDP